MCEKELAEMRKRMIRETETFLNVCPKDVLAHWLAC